LLKKFIWKIYKIIKKINFQLRNLKEEGKLGQGDEPTGEDVDDLENDDLSEMTSISEENEVI